MRDVPAVFIVTLLSLSPMGAALLEGQSTEPVRYEETGIFQSPRVNESSGIAVSRHQPGILWTHNDSGDNAWIYATNLHGDALGQFRVRGAEAIDWEDISTGPCPDEGDGEACLFIADTGDNEARRRTVAIYIVPEPVVPAGARESSGWTRSAHRLRVTYPDGPHDVEAMAVTPRGDVLLVTKGLREPVLVFTITADQTSRRYTTASFSDTLPFPPGRHLSRLVTAAALSPSGRQLVVRTYTELYFFTADSDGKWKPDGMPCWLNARQPQGEAVDFLDELSVVLTSESVLGRAGGVAVATCRSSQQP